MKRSHSVFLSSSDDEAFKTDADCSENPSRNPDVILEQDRFLPIANISRIMKKILPSEAKLSKEAKECVQECVTEFLLFITSEASERCSNEKRKTITGEDLLDAFRTLGFDGYVTPLETFLKKYREANKINVNTTKQETSQTTIEKANTKETGNDNQNGTFEAPMPNPNSLRPMEMYLDSATNQYYAAVKQANGTHSLVQVNLTPIGGLRQPPTATYVKK